MWVSQTGWFILENPTKMVYQIYIIYPQGYPLMVIGNLIITDIPH
jgi:hypothetical protein